MENKNTDILELFEIQNNIWNEDILKSEILEDKIEIQTKIEFIENNDVLKIFEKSQEKEIIENEIIYSLPEEKNTNFTSTFFANIFFVIKYFATSSLIFAILLIATNYSAYIEIARSYLNPEWLEQNRKAMLASVLEANIIKTSSGETTKQEEIKEIIEEKIPLAKNTTYHSMDKLVNKSLTDNIDMNIEIVPYDNRIVIPKIWKNIPLIEVQNKTVKNVKELEDVFMKELVNWIVRYPWSARPGELWNSFIFGHSSNFPWLEWKYNDVFALLDNVVFWDEVIAYYWQKKYTYKIKEKKIIKPGDVSILKRDNWISEISLMTCWPIWTTLNRMIVIWELVKE